MQTYNSTSATFAVVDSTNITISFTGPASGNVRIATEIYGATVGGSSITQLALFVHGGAVVTNTEANVIYNAGATGTGRIHYEGHLTGLTLGTSYQYDLAFANAGSGTSTVYAGGGVGAAVLQVFAE